MATAVMNLVKRAGRLVGIGGNPGPQGALSGITASSSGAPPLMSTRAMLEGFDTMPWLRAAADKVGTALALTDWRLYAVGKPPGKSAIIEASAARYEFRGEDLAQAASAAVAAEVARRIRIIRGQLEPWAMRDAITQRLLPAQRWKSLELLRKRGQLQEIADHPFYAALENPNPFMGRMGLVKLTEISLDLVGDAFWLKERNGAGAPVGFWPIPAHWITETPTPSRPFFRASWQAWQRQVQESEILWFHEPSPVHPFERGSGIGFAIGDELEIDEYLAKMTKQMFFNDADPKWIFAGGEGTSEAEMRRLERDFLQKNQGFWRKFKPYFLVGGGDDINKRIHEFQRPTMEQLVYPGLRKAQRDVVLQTWGAPPELFGITENSNRATVEAAEYLFAKWVILPRAERMRSIIQSKLLPEYDDRLILDFPSPVQEDKEHQLAVMKAAPWAWDADEWRARAGDAPLEVSTKPGGVYMVPLNSFATSDLLDPEQRPKASAGVSAPDDPEQTPEEPKPPKPKAPKA
jgi:Phage portal protein